MDARNDMDPPDMDRPEDMIGRLLDFAGPRPEAPADLLAEVKRRAHPVWRAKVEAHARARRRRDRVRWLAAAAVLVLAAGIVYWQRGRGAAAAATARVETALDADRLGTGRLAVGDLLAPGSEVETAAGGYAALRLAGGASLRLDAATRLRLESPAVLALQRGAVYLDSGPGRDGGIEVRTPLGVARDVGTQFEVRLGEGELRLRVREGEVALEVDATSHLVRAGGFLAVTGDGTVAIEDADAAGYGPAWRWVLDAAPSFDPEGRTLGELLDWVARETGWQLRFADPALAQEARSARLHGSLAGLPPDQAAELVLPSSGLAYRLDGGTLIIERATP
jgi:FecR protein